MIKIREVNDINELINLKDEWNELLTKSKSDNIFLTHQWVSTWWKFFGEGKKLKVILVENNNIFVGIAPFMIENIHLMEQIKFIGEPQSDYHDFIILKGEERVVLDALFNYLRHLKDWDIMQLKEISQDSETLDLVFNNSFYWKRKSIQSICPILKLPDNIDDLYNSLSKKMRHNLRYYRKRLEKEFELTFEDIEKKDILKKNMETMFELHGRRWAKINAKGAFIGSNVKDFFNEVTSQFFNQEWLLLRIMNINLNPVSICYNFKYNQKIYYYQSGRDPEWSKYSVGDILLADTIRYAIEKGYLEFDFTRGDEDYKKHWSTQNRINYRLELVNDRLLSKGKYLVFRSLTELKALIKYCNFK